MVAIKFTLTKVLLHTATIQGDSYSIVQTLTGGRFQPLDTLTKMSRFYG
jgi:hypothetical protein